MSNTNNNRQTLTGLWKLATDPENKGRTECWFQAIRGEAQPAPVPGIIQQVFPDYHGVAWYWHEFRPAVSVSPNQRCLLRFGAVDYLAEVWLNGIAVGGHKGGETPFVLDVTDALKPDAENLLAVRVINPTNEPIDGLLLAETPHRNKVVPHRPGASYNLGGILSPVRLWTVPAVRITDVFARPDMAAECVRLQVTVQNDTDEVARGALDASVAPASGGDVVGTTTTEADYPPGATSIDITCSVVDPHWWNLDDPYLYSVTTRLAAQNDPGVTWTHEYAARFGFRDFRFEDGYFRLNGKRIFLRSSHTGNDFPVGIHLPVDPDLMRRDLLYAKTAGFNMIRFIAGMPYPEQLDFCDEIGLMVYEENYASWGLGDSPQMAQRYDRSFAEMVVRDRNHPSVTIWGMLNETGDGPVFRHAIDALSLVRSLDDTRVTLLNSGRFDEDLTIGSISNPGSDEWQCLMGAEGDYPGEPYSEFIPLAYRPGAGDMHTYPRTPHSAKVIHFFRNVGRGTRNIAITEYGIGSSVNAIRLARLYEQLGTRPDLYDYQLYLDWAERFMADFKRFGLDEVFVSPEDLLNESMRAHSEHRLVGINAIRANPHISGYSITGTVDQGMTGEGMWTTFREFKPGIMDALQDGWAPLRWCLFAEPVHGYRGRPFQVDVVLANEDVLLPGEYPARLQIFGPEGIVLDRHKALQIPDPGSRPEPPMAFPVFSEEFTIDGPAGKYEIVAYFEHGAAPVGGRGFFYVSDEADFPSVDVEVTLWGDEARLAQWLQNRGIRCRRFADEAAAYPEVILVGGLEGPVGDAPDFRELARRIASGGTAIFLTLSGLKRGDQELGWLPMKQKGELIEIYSDLYMRDDVAKEHPIFAGLPTKGFLDWVYYREILPDHVFDGQETPEEVTAAGVAVGTVRPPGYRVGALIATYPLGAGHFILNSLWILENLGIHPAADRLLLNMINYAATFIDAPLAPLPDDFGAQLKSMGYDQ